jgi:hypothetical protein
MNQLLIKSQFVPNLSFTYKLLRMEYILINGQGAVVNMHTKRMSIEHFFYPH